MHAESTGSRRAAGATARLRLLLFSDLLLDRAYEWAPPAIADARRAAARQALVELLGAARARSVDVVACAGDLFDRRTVAPATMKWLTTALRSAGVPVLIAPGDRDFVGPLGGYTAHRWPDNVVVFQTDRLIGVDVGRGVRIWGAAHTEAHRWRSFLDRFEVDGGDVNLALFHGAERSGANRETGLDPCAEFDEDEIGRAGIDHALVGHYRRPHLGLLHTYPGAPLAHEFGYGPTGGGVVLTVTESGAVERECVAFASPPLNDVSFDLTGARTNRDALKRVSAAVADANGVVRLRVTGRCRQEIVLRHDDLTRLAKGADDVLLAWEAEIEGVEELASEPTVRGQFVRDVLEERLDPDRRQRILLIGLRALAGSDVLEAPR
ncbi:MAG: metallophosphoesterase [Actinomycetota bacterium]|nr:metallophosphoesterase [Actinomycetota bacterium]